jgi:transposase
MKSLDALSREDLVQIIERQAEMIAQLKARITELEGQISKNSRNSHRPPSSDGLKKVRRTKSERSSSTRSTGGQPGHSGHHLSFSLHPDVQEVHSLTACPSCGDSLASLPVVGYQKRQVWDLAPISLQVTEHQAEQKICPCCRKKVTAAFPSHVAHSVQYGTRIQALLVYLHHAQLLPYARTVELVRDVFHHSISEGTVANILRRAYEALAPLEHVIKETVLASPVLHVDETGMEVWPKREWVHVYSTKKETYYAIHPKRGKEAINDIGILPAYKGTAVHDAWQAYFPYTDCSHALCNAHILRELTFLHEHEQQDWAKSLHDLLIEMKRTKERYESLGLSLPEEEITIWEARFDDLIAEGCEKNPVPFSPETLKKKGRKKQSVLASQRRWKVLLFSLDKK